MDKESIIKALHLAKEHAPKRNFKQTIDVILTAQNLDIKKTENHVDVFAQLHFSRGKPVKVAALVGPEMKDAAKEAGATVILLDDFDKYQKDKVATKKLANDHDFFIAQANLMPKVAAAFGKVFGPRGKMPNPKAGCVVPTNANLVALAKKLQKTVRVSMKTGLMYQTYVGTEETKEEELIDNIQTIYNAFVHALPNEENNVKNVIIKYTMGPSVRVGQDKVETPEEREKRVQAQKEAIAKRMEEKKALQNVGQVDESPEESEEKPKKKAPKKKAAKKEPVEEKPTEEETETSEEQSEEDKE